MDQAVLVASSHELIKELDKIGVNPQFAMLVHNQDVDTWKLWLVTSDSKIDKYDFYRKVSEVISRNRTSIGDLSSSDIELIGKTHPAIIGLTKIIRIDGLGSVNFAGNLFNGYYMPDGIILRSSFT